MRVTFAASALALLSNCKTVASAVLCATKTLRVAQVPEAAASAEHLAAAAFAGTTRGECRRSSRVTLPAELERFQFLVDERVKRRVPVQYLVGDWDFHNIVLKVRPPVLIPRPETEELVELLLSDETLDRDAPVRVLDVGCGSGAILLAVLAARPSWTGVGIDVSQDAVALSLENARSLGFADRATIRHVGVEEFSSSTPFDVIVSNPPYIPTAEMDGLQDEVRLHEDRRALCGGADGLDVVTLLLGACGALKSGGNLWLEVDESHPALLRDTEDMRYTAKFNDLSGKPRFCRFTKV